MYKVDKTRGPYGSGEKEEDKKQGEIKEEEKKAIDGKEKTE